MQELKLSGRFKNIIEEFIQRLKDVYKDGLVSVVLYGSAASGEFINKQSNINLLVILDNTSLSNLSKVATLINKKRFNIINTLFFTADYIKNSTDVFPIEFLDMKENYAVLYGKDILKEINIDTRNLRFQCEQELKAKLINIKRLYLRNTNNFALRNLLLKSFTSVLHILRNLVRLKNKTPSYLKEEVLKDIAKEFPLGSACFNKILEVKNKNLRLTHKETEDLFSDFVKDLEKVIDIVDRF